MNAVAPSAARAAGIEVPALPWEDRPIGEGVLWRRRGSLAIGRDAAPLAGSVCSGAVVPWGGGFAGVFSCDDGGAPDLHCGFSDDGFSWELDSRPIGLVGDPAVTRFDYRRDPRATWLEDRFVITWCNGFHGPSVGVGYTWDFANYFQLESALLPPSGDASLFPRRIAGKYVLLSRAGIHDFYSESPDLTYWGRHRPLAEPRLGRNSSLCSAYASPIETCEGWLLLHAGACRDGEPWGFGAALLDLDQPWNVIRRAGAAPHAGPPCAALLDAPTGRLAIYYAAGTGIGLAFGYVDEILDWLKHNAEVN